MSALSGRRVLVTGVSGFVGDHLARALTKAGADVWGSGFERDTVPSACTEGTVHHYSAGLDVADLEAVDRLIAQAKPDAVVHLAGQSSAARSFEAPVETFQVNVIGTWCVLEAVRRHAPAARTVVVASGEIYGAQRPGERAREDAPFRPVSPYALSKAGADAMAEAFARANGLDVIRARAFGHSGPGQDARFIIPSVAKQIAALEAGEGEPVLKVGNLEVERDLCDVRDIAAGYIALLERGQAGAAYNLCRGEGVRLSEVVRQLVARAKVRVRIEIDPARMRPADVERLVGDPARIEADTGWRASIPLDRTLGDVLDEWRGRTASGG